MKPSVHSYHAPREKVAIAFSSKERMDFTRESFPTLAAETGFDLFWMDGSKSEEGKALPFTYAAEGRLAEIHQHVGGGADAAILYALSALLEKGYDYIGLAENDVKLAPGWFQKTFGLFARGAAEGLSVGAVSARCHAERILVPRDGYALMYNLGAGMIILTREAAQLVLETYRTGTTGEVAFLFSHYTSLLFPVPWQVSEPSVASIPQIRVTGDWMFEASLLPAGLVALAPTPTLAHNLDDPKRHPLQDNATKADPTFSWASLCVRLASRRQGWLKGALRDDPVAGLMPHYDPTLKQWRAYPHQLAKASPASFEGPWRAVWSKFLGPFGFMTMAEGAALYMLVHGQRVDFLFDGKGEPFEILINGETTMRIDEKDDWQVATLGFSHSGPHGLSLRFSRPGVMLGMMLFEGPQPWFKSGYALRYADLARYIEAEA